MATIVNTTLNIIDVISTLNSNNLHTYNIIMFNGKFIARAMDVSDTDSTHARLLVSILIIRA